MDIFVSDEAQTDLAEIAQYTQEKWGVKQRRKYLRALNSKFQEILESPLLCRERNEFSPPVRFCHNGQHLIIYLIIKRGVLIVRVIHGSADVNSQLSDEH